MQPRASSPKFNQGLESKMSLRLVLTTLLFCAGAQAQWVNYRDPGLPRNKDGKVNMSAKTPRASDGKPDLTGVWMHEPTPVAEMKKLFGNVAGDELADLPIGMNLELQNKYGFDMLLDYDKEWLANFKAGQVPAPMPLMRPAGMAVMAARRAAGIPDNCHGENYGWPVAGMLSEAIKILQAPKETMILYEVGDLHREIFADGRPLPKEFDLPAFMGYSVAHWEGDTFVVDTAGFNTKTAIDIMGHPRSEQMHVTERLRRPDFGHLDMQITYDDPTYYTQPFTVKIGHTLVPDYQVYEMFCENEKDLKHLTK